MSKSALLSFGVSAAVAALAIFTRAVFLRRNSERELRKCKQDLERKIEEHNAKLSVANARLRTLAAGLLRAEDQERRRFARDLHDSAGQILTALAANVAEIESGTREIVPAVSALAGETQTLVQQLTNEIRTTSYLLHPPLLDENGLVHALGVYVRGLGARSNLKTELTISERFGRLPPDVELTIFRIVQEALTNVHRHSGARNAAVRLFRQSGNVIVEIQDDGVGISQEVLAGMQSRGTGVGMSGICERARYFGGEINIESNIRGTHIFATIPVPQKPVRSVENSTEPVHRAG